MTLSNDLISQFVKITKDKQDTKKETVVYGTIQKDDSGNDNFVNIDGSNISTPVAKTVVANEGDRVTVMIKNHTATVTGNLSNPSARAIDTLNVSDFSASNAKIGQLEAANVTITNRLDAHEGYINDLEVDNVNVKDRLTVAEADIQHLKGETIDTEKLNAAIAFIDELDVENAEIKNLISDVAKIDELMFGSASGDVIQTSFSNAVIAQLGDAQIKSAMIDNISASKITSGDIITNNVRVKSRNGSLIISDETLQISDGTRVRVQVGKDAASDYSINIWDQNGNLMFSKGGITDAAIKEAIIRNDMVSETANIHASKLDVDSLFEEINGSTNTIKSTHIYVDDKKQTLDVAFKSLTTDMTTQGQTISSQGTQISTIQGQISSKIWQQDIDITKDALEEQTEALSTRYSTLEQNLNGFKAIVSDTYATKNSVNDLEIGGRNLLRNTSTETYTTTLSGWQKYLNDQFPFVTSQLYRVSGMQKLTLSAYVENVSGIDDVGLMIHLVTPDTEYGHMQLISTETVAPGESKRISVTARVTQDIPINNVTEVRVALRHYSATATDNIVNYHSVKLEFGDKVTDWTPAPEDVDVEITNFDSRILSAESSIEQLSNRITTNVTETTNLGTRMTTIEQTAEDLSVELDNLEIGGRNYISYKDLTASDCSFSATDTNTIIFDTLGDGNISMLNFGVNLQPGTYTLNATGSASEKYFRVVVNNTNNSLPSLQYNTYYETKGFSYYTDIYLPVTFTLNESTNIGFVMCDEYGTQTITGLKLEKGDKPTDWSPAPEDIESDILEASKTATNYLNFSSSGLVIGDLTADTLGKNVLIDSDSVDIRNGNTTLASFGADYLYLAKNSRNAKIDLCNGLATMYHESKYSYDTIFIIDTGNTTEIMGLINPLCVTSVDDLDQVSIQFANANGVMGGIGIVGNYLRRFGSNMFDNYTILDKGNFDDVMDSGWISGGVLGENFAIYSNDDKIQYRKIGKIVHIRGTVRPTTIIPGSSDNHTIFTLPEGYRPSKTVNVRCQGSGSYSWLLSITTSGLVRFARYNDGTKYVDTSTTSWLPFDATFFID